MKAGHPVCSKVNPNDLLIVFDRKKNERVVRCIEIKRVSVG
jgi:hypothetical protein